MGKGSMNVLKNGLMLREFEGRDWKDVHEYASLEIVCKHQPWGPNTEAESQEFVQGVLNDLEAIPRTRFAFALEDPATHKVIGTGELNIRDFHNRTGEIGYIVHPDYWGKGIATELGRFLLHYGFQEHNLHRIYATCEPKNSGSKKVLEKLGMIQEGRMREHLKLQNGWRDSLLFSILEHEWTNITE